MNKKMKVMSALNIVLLIYQSNLKAVHNSVVCVPYNGQYSLNNQSNEYLEKAELALSIAQVFEQNQIPAHDIDFDTAVSDINLLAPNGISNAIATLRAMELIIKKLESHLSEKNNREILDQERTKMLQQIDEQNKKIEQQEKFISEFTRDVQEKLLEYANENKNLKDVNAVLKNQITKISEQVGSKADVDALDVLQQLIEQKDLKNDARIIELSDKLSNLRQACATREELENHKKDLKAKCKSIQQELIRQNEKLDAHDVMLASLEERVSSINKEINGVSSNMNALSQKIGNIEKNVIGNAETIGDMRNEINALKQKVKEVNVVKENINTLENKIISMQHQMQGFATKSELSGNLDNIKDEINKMNRRIQEDKSELDSKIADIHVKISEITKVLIDLNNKVDSFRRGEAIKIEGISFLNFLSPIKNTNQVFNFNVIFSLGGVIRKDIQRIIIKTFLTNDYDQYMKDVENRVCKKIAGYNALTEKDKQKHISDFINKAIEKISYSNPENRYFTVNKAVQTPLTEGEKEKLRDYVNKLIDAAIERKPKHSLSEKMNTDDEQREAYIEAVVNTFISGFLSIGGSGDKTPSGSNCYSSRSQTPSVSNKVRVK